MQSVAGNRSIAQFQQDYYIENVTWKARTNNDSVLKAEHYTSEYLSAVLARLILSPVLRPSCFDIMQFAPDCQEV